MRLDARGRSRVILLTLTLLTVTSGTATAGGSLVASSFGVTVSNPNLLPPPGSGAAWVDHPCSHDLRYDFEATVNGQPESVTLALAHDAIVTGFGTPTLSTDGNDVISTFSATLHLAASIVVGFPMDPPMDLTLPGTITARFIGKVGKTTGTFLLRLDAMSFSTKLFSIPVEARQDPDHPSVGSIAITDLGGGAYRIASGLDAHTQIRLYVTPESGSPYWLPWSTDSLAPIHFELDASSCPPASYPFADFGISSGASFAGQTVAVADVLTGAALAGQSVGFTDTSTGSPTSRAWDFGDGGTSTAQNPSHVFSAAGTYAVRLTVTNAYGSDSVAKLVTTGAGSSPFTVWVPVASHNGGKNGSRWRSDLGLLNLGAAQANVQLSFFGSGSVVTSSTLVPAGTQSILADVVEQIGGANSGAIEVVSDQPLKVTARSYNQVATDASCYPGGTQGQDYPAVTASDGLAAQQSAYLAGLTENASYHCNIGVVNTGTGSASVLVELFNGAGTKLTDYTVPLTAGLWAQETQPFLGKAGQTAMDRGYAKITVQSGSGVFAFASVISNATNDPTTIAMQSSSVQAATAQVGDVPVVSVPAFSAWVPVASHNGGKNGSQWRSDLGLLNLGAAQANVQLSFYGSGPVVTNATYVPAGTQSILTDVVEQIGGANSGAIEVVSDRSLLVTARSYNQVATDASCYPGGTQGQDYPAVPPSSGLSAGESAYLAGLTENASYHCNIGVVNTGTGNASVLVELFNGAGTKLTDYTVPLTAGLWAQETQPFLGKAGQTAMDRGYAKVTVQSGSGVFAFASVIDNLTNDPTTVTMQR